METKKRPIQSINYGLMAKKTIETIYETFQTSKRGLTEGQAIAARNKYGSNQISYGKKTPFIMEVLKAYITPFTLVLIGLGITSFITEVVIAAPEERDYFGSGIIFVMILISGTMTLIQSVQSNKAAEKLKSLVKVTATVKRKSVYAEVPMEEIVCGDIVKLSAGDMIPADIRLTATKDLFISQSALTGESYPVEKMPKQLLQAMILKQAMKI